VALLGTSGGVAELEGIGGSAKFSSSIQCAVPMGARSDLLEDTLLEITTQEDRGKIWRQFLGGSLEEKRSTYKLASPLHHLDQSDPPMAFLAGQNDGAHTRGDTIRKRMMEIEIPSHLRTIDGAPHAFLNRQGWFDQCLDHAGAWFTIHLKVLD
jgi:acetyl esterase/lipase